jgi:hypothetical protein
MKHLTVTSVQPKKVLLQQKLYDLSLALFMDLRLITRTFGHLRDEDNTSKRVTPATGGVIAHNPLATDCAFRCYLRGIEATRVSILRFTLACRM